MTPSTSAAANRRGIVCMVGAMGCFVTNDAGPGRVGQALGITRAHNALAINAPPFELLPAPTKVKVVSGPRIGISKAVDQPWRFGLAGSPFLSRPFRQW